MRMPEWFRQEIPRNISLVKNRIEEFEQAGLHTVCKSARCPNLGGCFQANSVTFMIMGDSCSRNCSFCAVNKSWPRPLDLSEPYKLALTIRKLGLEYIVLTSVTRDDLTFGGASHYVRCVRLIQSLNPGKKIELLIPDFRNDTRALELVIGSRPDIIAHNLETVESLYLRVRPLAGGFGKGKPNHGPLASYQGSLEVLKKIKELGFAGWTKSGIMLGFGESEEVVLKALADLKKADCDIITLGQYLAPSPRHFPVQEFIPPEKFEFYKDKAQELGFKAVSSGPLVRSSYRAGEVYKEVDASGFPPA